LKKLWLDRENWHWKELLRKKKSEKRRILKCKKIGRESKNSLRNKRKDRLQLKRQESLNLKESTMRPLPKRKEKQDLLRKRNKKKKDLRLRRQLLLSIREKSKLSS